MRELANRILEQLPLVAAELRGQKLTHEVLDGLETSIGKFAATKAG